VTTPRSTPGPTRRERRCRRHRGRPTPGNRPAADSSRSVRRGFTPRACRFPTACSAPSSHSVSCHKWAIPTGAALRPGRTQKDGRYSGPGAGVGDGQVGAPARVATNVKMCRPSRLAAVCSSWDSLPSPVRWSDAPESPVAQSRSPLLLGPSQAHRRPLLSPGQPGPHRSRRIPVRQLPPGTRPRRQSTPLRRPVRVPRRSPDRKLVRLGQRRRRAGNHPRPHLPLQGPFAPQFRSPTDHQRVRTSH